MCFKLCSIEYNINSFLNYLTPTKELYSNTLLSFSQKIIYESIFNIFKIKNSLVKSNFDLVRNINISARNTRSSEDLRLPNYKKALAQKSIYYRGIDLYNLLPSNITQITDIAKFIKLNFKSM